MLLLLSDNNTVANFSYIHISTSFGGFSTVNVDSQDISSPELDICQYHVKKNNNSAFDVIVHIY